MLVATLLLDDQGLVVDLVNGNQIQLWFAYLEHNVVVRVLHHKTVAAVLLQRIKI